MRSDVGREYWVDDTLTLPLPVLDTRPVIRQRPVQPLPRQEPEPGNRNLVSRVMAGLRDPAYRGSYALVANTVGTSVIGAGYWAVAAHLYSPQDLGRATSLISALMLVATLSQLNLSSIMMRFLPQMGSRTAARLINGSYLITTLTALAGSVIFVLLLPRLSSEWSFIGDSTFFVVIFAVAVVVWEIFTLQDSALIGLQRAGAVPIENVIYSLAKLVLLVAAVKFLGSTDILFSWIIPLILLIPIMNWLIFRILRERSPYDMVRGIRFSRLARFASVDYAGVICGQITGNVLPLLVISVLGPAAAGSFYVVSLITSGVASVGINFSTGLLVEAAAAPERLPEFTRGALKRCLITMGPATLVLAGGAHLILEIYGGNYIAHTAVLFQMLSLSLLPFCIETVAYSLDRIAGKPIRATLSQLAIAVMTLGGSWALFGRFGLNGVGIATLVGGIVVALVRLPTVIGALRGHGRVAAGPNTGPQQVLAEPASAQPIPAQPIPAQPIPAQPVPAQPAAARSAPGPAADARSALARAAMPSNRRNQPGARPTFRATPGWPAEPPTQPIRLASRGWSQEPDGMAFPGSRSQPGHGAQPAFHPNPEAQPASADQWQGWAARPTFKPRRDAQPGTQAEPLAQPGRPAAQPGREARPPITPEDHGPDRQPGAAGGRYSGRHRAAGANEAEQPADRKN